MPNTQPGGPGVSLFVWNLTLALSGFGDTASSNATAGITWDHGVTQVLQQIGDSIGGGGSVCPSETTSWT